MPVRYFIDEKRGFLIAHASGVLKHRQHIDALSAIVEQTNGAALFKPHLYLVDRKTLLHELTFDGIKEIKERFVAWAQIYPGRQVKTAFVVPDDMHALYARLWKALTEFHREIGSTVRLFDTEDEAVAWLNRKR